MKVWYQWSLLIFQTPFCLTYSFSNVPSPIVAALAELARHQHRAPAAFRCPAVVGHGDDRLQVQVIVELAFLEARAAAEQVEVLADALLADVHAVL